MASGVFSRLMTSITPRSDNYTVLARFKRAFKMPFFI